MDQAAPSSEHDRLRTLFSAEGLEFLGVAAVGDPSQEGERGAALARYRDWLAQGRQGTMDYLERHASAKYDPELALEGTRSVIIAGLGYFQPRPEAPVGHALVARYAWGRDYHKVLLAKLKRVAEVLVPEWPEARFRSFTDTAPIDERWWAAQAGASFTARNTLSINHTLGSWFLLGEILTTRPIQPTGPRPHGHGSCPSGCRRCRDVCPTGALDAEGRMDASRCISYLTIEHRGPIAEELKPAVGSWLFGCDLCQEVCPLNLKVKTTTEADFLAWKAGPDLALGPLLMLNDAEFTVRFAGSPVHRAGRSGLVRNACLVAANTSQTQLLPWIDRLTNDADAGVADAARWAMKRLQPGGHA